MKRGTKICDDLLKEHQHLLIVILDERSLLSTEILAIMSRYMAATLHGGYNRQEEFGGIPLFLLVGDDYQLPPPMALGAFDVFALEHWDQIKRYKELKKKNNLHKIGDEIWKRFGQDVAELAASKRQFEEKDKALMTRLRVGHTTEDDIAVLKNLSLKTIKNHHGTKVVQKIREQSLFLFANNNPMKAKNEEQLLQLLTETNPLALVKSHSSGCYGGKAVTSHFDNNTIPVSNMLCRKAKVSLTGRNFIPLYGLHNGAVGEVEEIIFHFGENPNLGHLPAYVVVRFPLYTGPIWDKLHPKVSYILIYVTQAFPSFLQIIIQSVPIPIVSCRCDGLKCCCERSYVPLTLAFARSIHKFQGLQAGRTIQGQIPNMYESIVVDPGNKNREGNCPGLLYTAVSRATTLGNEDGLDSALYFTEDYSTDERFRNITIKAGTADASVRRLFPKYQNKVTFYPEFHLFQRKCTVKTVYLCIYDKLSVLNKFSNITRTKNK